MNDMISTASACAKSVSMIGCFYVRKVNVLARFSFGKSESFDSINKAREALNAYLLKRKDGNLLEVGFVEVQ